MAIVYVGRELLGESSRFALDTYADGDRRKYLLFDAEAGVAEKSRCVYDGPSRADAMAIVTSHETAVHHYSDHNPSWPLGFSAAAKK